MRKRIEKFIFAILALAALLSGGLGFGMGCADTARVRAFTAAVQRWQINPDFRAVQAEYVALGADAMSARLCAIPAERYVMGFRSLPGLPGYLAVSESSATHYRAFSSGPLAAYLHLAGEQGVPAGVALVEDLGGRSTLSDEDARAFLRAFKLPVQVATDEGAVASVHRLARDVMPTTRPFGVRGSIVPAIRRHIGRDVDTIPRDEQMRIMLTLDEEIRRADLELWRTKQVSDFLAGIWAQGYGQVYQVAIGYLFLAQRIARIVCVMTFLALSAALMLHRARTGRRPSPAVIGRDAPLPSA